MKGVKRILIAIYILILGINFEYISNIYATESGDLKIFMLFVLVLSGVFLIAGFVPDKDEDK